jgi:plasmid stabilization system protein ParE
VKVVWSELAIDRAEEEAAFIAQDKPAAALRWLEGLFSMTDRLESLPESGGIVPEIGMPRYRQLVYGTHRIVYRLDDKVISILTVRRSRQLLRISDLA